MENAARDSALHLSIRASLTARLAGGIATALLLLALPKEAAAGYFELSSGFSYSKSNYGDGNFEWTRRWSASFGYHFSERSEIEIAFSDMVDRTAISDYQDTTFHDQTFSAEWVQSLFGRDAILDPYFKVGMGQLWHTATGIYSGVLGNQTVTPEQDSLTEILGVGARIGLTHRFGLRVEGDTYITNNTLSTWQDNVYVMAGLSIYF